MNLHTSVRAAGRIASFSAMGLLKWSSTIFIVKNIIFENWTPLKKAASEKRRNKIRRASPPYLFLKLLSVYTEHVCMYEYIIIIIECIEFHARVRAAGDFDLSFSICVACGTYIRNVR